MTVCKIPAKSVGSGLFKSILLVSAAFDRFNSELVMYENNGFWSFLWFFLPSILFVVAH